MAYISTGQVGSRESSQHQGQKWRHWARSLAPWSLYFIACDWGRGGGQIINSDFDNVRKQSCCEENKTEKEKLGGQLSSSSRPLRQRRQPGFTSRLNSEAGSGCLEQALLRVQGYTEPQLESRARCIGCVSSGLKSRQECQGWPRSKNGISPSIYSSQKPQP